jgi:hypothetical protein
MRTDHDGGPAPVWNLPQRAAPPEPFAALESFAAVPARSTPPSSARAVDVRVATERVEHRDRLRELVREAALVALGAIRSVGSLDAPIDEARPHLRAAGVIARERGVRAEQVILLLKEVLRQQREPHGLSRGEIEVVLARTVTLCIKEYFAPLAES